MTPIFYFKPIKGTPKRLEGAALIIVLSFLIIITGLVVAFLSSVTNEATDSASAAAAVTTRSLADAAVQLDIAQIRDATAGFSHASDGSLITNSPVCWASQPGAIRTYDTNASNNAVYKLYSSTNMVFSAAGGLGLGGSGWNPSNDLPPSGWASNTAQWVDLNSFVVSVSASDSSGSGTNLHAGASSLVTNTNYPIMDPAMTNLTNGNPVIDGFSISSNGSGLNVLSGVSNQAAMPVTWIYVLRNGTLAVPSSVSGNVASFATNIPTKTNPIVGRMAFWTDDETCKLNLNTASEGSFWGMPCYATLMDMSMALTAPVANEYNRFPGHPASTCLSPVLWSYMGMTNPGTYLGPLPGNPGGVYSLQTNISGNSLASISGSSNALNYYTNLFTNVTPRYLFGGSYAGNITNTFSGTNAIPFSSLPSGRLYSSVDEFFFASPNILYSQNPGLNASSLTNRVSNGVGLTPLQVSQLKFFLTTESRAPEVNPLNLPKITMWPIPDNTHQMMANVSAYVAANNRTLIDQAIAFCSTLGTNAYYFTRYDASSQNNDFTGRNTNVYNYLRNQLNQPIPGYKGGAFTTSKWGGGQADQICTDIFDYIRSSINLIDSTSVTNTFSSFSNSSYPYAYTAPPTNSLLVSTNTNNGVVSTSLVTILTNGTGQVIPITISNPDGTNTMGMGRFPTVRAGTLWIRARSADQPPLMCHLDRKPIVYDINGMQLSTNVAGVSYISSWSNLTTVLSGNAFAMVNPLHPWTCPVTNPVITINGKQCIMVPQLIATNAGNVVSSVVGGVPTNPVSTTKWAVMADSAPTKPIQVDIHTETLASGVISNVPTTIYPIFNLITNNGGVTARNANNTFSTRTYPSYIYNGSNSAFLYITNSFTTGNKTNYITFGTNTNAVPNYGPTSTNYGYAVAFITNVVTYGTAPSTTTYYTTNGTNITTNSLQTSTHTGLPYLTVQDTTNYPGAFDIKNSNFTANPDSNYYTASIPPHITRAEAVFYPELVNVAPGQVGLGPNLQITVSGLDAFKCNNNAMGFPASNNASMIVLQKPTTNNSIWNGFENRYGMSWSQTLLGRSPQATSDIWGTRTPLWANGFLITNTVTDPATGLLNSGTFSFTGGTIKILLKTTNSVPTTIQTVNMTFPNATFPAPKLAGLNNGPTGYANRFYPPVAGIPSGYSTDFTDIASAAQITFSNGLFCQGYNSPAGLFNFADGSRSTMPDMTFTTIPPSSSWYGTALGILGADTIASVEALYGDTRLIASLSNVPSSCFQTNPYYGYSNQLTINGWPCYNRNAYSTRNQGYMMGGDVMGFLLPADALGTINNTNLLTPWLAASNTWLTIYQFTNAPAAGASAPAGVTATNIFGPTGVYGGHYTYDAPQTPTPETTPTCDFANATFSALWAKGGDFDNGMGGYPDGPFINKVDEGYGSVTIAGAYFQSGLMVPYYDLGFQPAGYNTMSANRQIASPIMFGSLPVYDKNWDPANPLSTLINSSWRTLQFSPNPNALSTNALASRNSSAGYNEPDGLITNTILPDHLLLDFFTMPVVQPYPISDPFSTAGKVNMNYQIVPFSYINRDAAMRGVLKSVLITAVPESAGGVYKTTCTNSSEVYAASCFNSNFPTSTNYNQLAANSGNFYFHYPIDPSDTLAQFTNRFSQNDLFHSPSEICSVWLYPAQQPTLANGYVATNPISGITYTTNNVLVKGWWYNNAGTDRKGMTGDNIRERPYNYLYPRLTTKSNTYRIHYWVQTLKQTATAHPNDWSTWIDPGSATGISDKVTGDLRGSAVIERYIDPSDTSIPDFTTNVTSSAITTTTTMDSYYKFRVFNVKQFTP